MGACTSFMFGAGNLRFLAFWVAMLGVVPVAPVLLGTEPVTLTYRGAIDAERNSALFARARDVMSPERMVITSGGGSVKAGIALGRWVREQGLTLVVEDYCLSSCANYVFTAATRRIIRPGAAVGWHGNYRHLLETGLWREDAAARMARRGEDRATALGRARASAEELVALEQDFFAEIEVDDYLCWIGKMPPHNVANYYTLSVADMGRFGVGRVDAPHGYPDDEALEQVDGLRFIRLDESARRPFMTALPRAFSQRGPTR